MNYSNSQRAGVILYFTALLFGAYKRKSAGIFGGYFLRVRGQKSVLTDSPFLEKIHLLYMMKNNYVVFFNKHLAKDVNDFLLKIKSNSESAAATNILY